MKKIFLLIILLLVLMIFTAVGCDSNGKTNSSNATAESSEAINESAAKQLQGTKWELENVYNYAEWMGEDFYYYAMDPLVFQSDGTILTKDYDDYNYFYIQNGDIIEINDEFGIVLEGVLSEGELYFEAVYEGRDENTILVYKQSVE